MRLHELRVHALPGLRGGLHLRAADLRGRIRVIHGPNGIGKTSLVRAIRAVLWPLECGTPGTVEVDAEFEIQGEVWIASRRGMDTRWSRAGDDATRPNLPEWRHAAHMLIGLQDLRGAEDSADFVGQLRRELGGGFDLAAAELALGRAPRAGQAEARERDGAEIELQKEQRVQEEVLAESGGLPEKVSAYNQANELSSRAAAIEQARKLADARQRLSYLDVQLGRLPAGMERLVGDEQDRLLRLRSRLAQAQDDYDGCTRELLRLNQEIHDCALAGPIAGARLAELHTRAQTLRDREHDERRSRIALVGAHEREKVARAAFGPGADVETLARLDVGWFKRVDGFVDRAATLVERRRARTAELAALGPAIAITAPDPTAAIALDGWLAAPTASNRLPVELLALRLATLTLIGLAVAAAIWIHIGWALTILPSALILWRLWSPTTGSLVTRVQRQTDFQRTSEAPPVRWDDLGVRERLRALRMQEAASRDAEVLADRRSTLEASLTGLEHESAELERQRDEIRRTLGTAADAPDTALRWLVQAFEELRAAGAETSRLAGENEGHALALADARAVMRDTLHLAAGGAAAEDNLDSDAAEAVARDLDARSNRLVSLQRECSGQEVARNAAGARRDEAQADMAALWMRIGLGETDDLGLARRIEAFPEWRGLNNERAHAQAAIAEHEIGLDSGLSGASAASLVQLVADARSAGDRAQILTTDIANIRARIDAAEKSRRLEDARARRDEAKGKLHAAFDDACHRELACALLAEVRAAHEAESEPALLERARSLFTRFTHGRHDLRAARGERGGLTLRTSDDRNALEAYELSELSDGTRAQLLLAARLAFLQEIERGESLPVVLDDALATSDPARKQAIAAALVEISNLQNRQVIVLTTDAADVDLLRPAGSVDGEVLATDLRERRDADVPVAARSRLKAPTVLEVPSHDGLSPEQYAEVLRVPPVDPLRPVEELHLWYVLRQDLTLLQRVLSHRFERVGAFERAATLGVPFPTRDELARVRPWIELARSILHSWRVGRGRPIDRDTLTHAGVTPTFLDRMTDLAQELGWDAKAWVDTVEKGTDERSKRYRADTLRQNRDFLATEGYLDDREVFDAETAWSHALSILPEGHGIPPGELRARFDLLWRACSS